MATRAQKLKLGVFLVASAILFGVALVVFAGLAFWETKDTYYALFRRSVSGLEIGAPVQVQGVQVGTVREMRLSREAPAAVVVELEVESETPIRADAIAHMEALGVTGIKFIDIRGGSAGAPLLEPGATIAGESALIDKLMEEGEDIAAVTSDLLRKLERLADNLVALTAPANAEKIEHILTRTESAVTKIDVAAGELAQVIEQTSEVLDRTQRSLAATLASIEQASAGVEGMIEGSTGLVEDTRALVNRNAPRVDAAVRDIQRAAQSFRELSQNLRDRPSRLLFGQPPKERELP